MIASHTVSGQVARLVRLLLASTALFGVEAAAQVPPASIDAGRQQQQFTLPVAPQRQPGLGSFEVPEGARPESADKIKLNLQSVQIEGASVYTSDQLGALAKPYLDREITLDQLFDLAAAITARYRADGYVLSRAVVPPQRIQGTARIVVVEGYIEKIDFDGPATAQQRRFAERLKAQRPLTVAALERYLLLMNDVPGYSARAVFAPSADALGGTDMTLSVRAKRLDAFAGIDNRGTRYVGPWQSYVGGSYSGALGAGDRTSVQIVTVPGNTGELRYGQLAQEFMVGTEGTRILASFARSVSRPGYTLKAFDARSSGSTAQLGVSHPWVRSRTANVSLTGAAIYRDSTTILNNDRDFINSSDDRTRALRIGISGSREDAFAGISGASLDLTKGFNAFGASAPSRLKGTDLPPPSRDGGRADFSKLTGEVSRAQGLPWIADGVSLLAAASGQWAFNQTLLASEQFGVGGSGYGRGYDPSEITGDYGWAGKLELQYFRVFDRPALENAQFYAFYDAGQIGLSRRGSLTSGMQSLASAGAGTRVSLGAGLSLNAEIAKPLTRPVATQADSPDPNGVRFFMGLMARY
jgi:hemolysin activation/secretion protein